MALPTKGVSWERQTLIINSVPLKLLFLQLESEEQESIIENCRPKGRNTSLFEKKAGKNQSKLPVQGRWNRWMRFSPQPLSGGMHPRGRGRHGPSQSRSRVHCTRRSVGATQKEESDVKWRYSAPLSTTARAPRRARKT